MPNQEFIANLTKILEGDLHSGYGWAPNDKEEKDYAISFVNDLLKANPNHPHALNLCGYMHKKGIWTGSYDNAQAIHFYDRAIEHGSAPAMRNRALLHKEGSGCPENLIEAKSLLLKASALGSTFALDSLAEIYINESNFAEAVLCYLHYYTMKGVNLLDRMSLLKLEKFARHNLDAQQVLCLIYIKQNNRHGLEKIHQLNPTKLNTFLCQRNNKTLK